MAIFDTEAGDYDKWYDSKLGALVDRVETDLIFKLLEVKRGMKVLDVGCGTGNFSIKLSEMGCKVIGIDLSEEMLEKAKKKAESKNLDIDFRIMDVYDLKFEDESFDLVISVTAFEFIRDIKKAYDEMYRVLIREGSLLIGTINRDSSWGDMYNSKEVKENSIFKYAELKTMDELIGLNKEGVLASKYGLFTPPFTSEDNISLESELEFSKKERGGFLCVLWKKN